MHDIEVIDHEHSIIRKILSRIYYLSGNYTKKNQMLKLLRKLLFIWERHERKEEEIFSKLAKKYAEDFPEVMLIQQHRELRGHWKVIEEAINSDDEKYFTIAFDSDGKMLIEKFRKHMDYEEEIFDRVRNANISSQDL